jgi:hypothetical protein
MATSFHKKHCPKCGVLRSPDFKIPCEMCHSRIIPILGYTYGVERTWFLIIVVALFLICLLAVVIGAVYVLGRVWGMSSTPFDFVSILNISLGRLMYG